MVVVFVFYHNFCYAADIYTDANKFIANNPDGKKYDFVKNYLCALSYLNENIIRDSKTPPFSLDNFEDLKTTKAQIDNYTLSNINLRISKNYLRKFKTPANGLMLKVADLFTRFCDEQIELNNQERTLLQQLYDLKKNNAKEQFKKDDFIKKFENFENQRRKSLEGLLESSLLVTKVLISDKKNKFGELVNLGISERERKKLLRKLDDFKGEEFKGAIREGQTFLAGSISAIREILEDPTWGTIK